MRTNLITLFLTTVVASSCFAQTKKATYYRVWQGFKKAQLSQDQFLNQLPKFMEDTQNIYQGRALNQYLVALPPNKKPNFIPDEFALVALHDEASYREIRSTDEGRWYGKRHWDVFEKGPSKSAPFHNFFQDKVTELEHNHAYDMFGTANDWSEGETLFYLGLRKDNVSRTEFLKKLKKHIELVKKSFAPLGLKGYIIISNENYEMAYINWESKEKMLKAFESEVGKKVVANGAEILERLMFHSASPYRADQVRENSFIKL